MNVNVNERKIISYRKGLIKCPNIHATITPPPSNCAQSNIIVDFDVKFNISITLLENCTVLYSKSLTNCMQACSKSQYTHSLSRILILNQCEMICGAFENNFTTKFTMRRRSFSNIYGKETSCCTAVQRTILNDCDAYKN